MIDKQYSYIIGAKLGINKIKGDNPENYGKDKLPESGFCKSHGYFSLDISNSNLISQGSIEFECPYCKINKTSYNKDYTNQEEEK